MKAPTPRRLLLGLLACASLAALPTTAETVTYSLAGDFSYTENTANSTWSYRMDDWKNNPPAFLPLLHSTSKNANELWGTTFETPPMMWSQGEGYWCIGKNTTGVEQFSGDITWAPDEVLLHPMGGDTPPSRMVVGWTSPFKGVMDVNYTFGRASLSGNGIGYNLIYRSSGGDTELVGFTYIGASLTGNLTAMSVNTGDQLFFRFDCWGGAGGDISRADIVIIGTPAAYDTKPAIVTQPSGGSAVAGGDFTFTVVATGVETAQYLKNGNPIPGASNVSYTISDLKTTDAGTYSVVLSNPKGSVTSEDAILTITPAPSFATYTEAVLADNPIHYYRLEETEGTVAADIGTLATVGGAYLGGFTLGQDSVAPRLGKCVRFDGTPGTLVDLGLFHPGDSVSVESWVNLDSDARDSWSAVLGRMEGSYELNFDASGTVNWNIMRGTGVVQAYGKGSSERARWHHVVGIFDGGTGKVTVYVDGVKGTEAICDTVLQNVGPTPDRVMIGAVRSGSSYSFNWKGLMDEVAFYDYALNAAQIRAHYRATVEGPPTLTKQSGVMVSWPNFPVGYVLQSAINVTGPYENYTGSIFTEGNTYVAPVPIGPPQTFFQLLKP